MGDNVSATGKQYQPRPYVPFGRHLDLTKELQRNRREHTVGGDLPPVAPPQYADHACRCDRRTDPTLAYRVCREMHLIERMDCEVGDPDVDFARCKARA